jgi:hypothetical protein
MCGAIKALSYHLIKESSVIMKENTTGNGMEDSKKTSEDEEAEPNSSEKLTTYVLCFAGIASIILVWIMVPDFAMQFTLFAIPVTGFIIFAMKKGWLNTGLNGWME